MCLCNVSCGTSLVATSAGMCSRFVVTNSNLRRFSATFADNSACTNGLGHPQAGMQTGLRSAKVYVCEGPRQSIGPTALKHSLRSTPSPPSMATPPWATKRWPCWLLASDFPPPPHPTPRKAVLRSWLCVSSDTLPNPEYGHATKTPNRASLSCSSLHGFDIQRGASFTAYGMSGLSHPNTLHLAPGALYIVDTSPTIGSPHALPSERGLQSGGDAARDSPFLPAWFAQHRHKGGARRLRILLCHVALSVPRPALLQSRDGGVTTACFWATCSTSNGLSAWRGSLS